MSPASPPTLSPDAARDVIVEAAAALGFHRVGVVAVGPARRYRAYREWLAAGHHGTMRYMADHGHIEARRDVRALLEHARTAVVVALAYDPGFSAGPAAADPAASEPDPSAPDPSEPDAGAPARGVISRYARGDDYHGVLKRKLYRLAERVGEAAGGEVGARPCVDSAPVLERDLAEAAGLGFTGKNTMLISPGLGSYTVLGELLLTVAASPTPVDARTVRDRCGDCRACLDACPTDAFPAPYTLDARRCVSYLTIEHQGPIDPALRPGLGAMIFGCDICQEVCPFNARAPARHAPDPALAARTAERGAPDLLSLLSRGSNQLRRYVEGSPLRRTNRHQLRRNVCVALGNVGDARALPALTGALSDKSPLVRGHAAWALGRVGARAARADRDEAGRALSAALATEAEAAVQGEIRAALAALDAAR